VNVFSKFLIMGYIEEVLWEAEVDGINAGITEFWREITSLYAWMTFFWKKKKERNFIIGFSTPRFSLKIQKLGLINDNTDNTLSELTLVNLPLGGLFSRQSNTVTPKYLNLQNCVLLPRLNYSFCSYSFPSTYTDNYPYYPDPYKIPFPT